MKRPPHVMIHQVPVRIYGSDDRDTAVNVANPAVHVYWQNVRIPSTGIQCTAAVRAAKLKTTDSFLLGSAAVCIVQYLRIPRTGTR